jgi:hypothetical protein
VAEYSNTDQTRKVRDKERKRWRIGRQRNTRKGEGKINEKE